MFLDLVSVSEPAMGMVTTHLVASKLGLPSEQKDAVVKSFFSIIHDDDFMKSFSGSSFMVFLIIYVFVDFLLLGTCSNSVLYLRQLIETLAMINNCESDMILSSIKLVVSRRVYTKEKDDEVPSKQFLSPAPVSGKESVTDQQMNNPFLNAIGKVITGNLPLQTASNTAQSNSSLQTPPSSADSPSVSESAVDNPIELEQNKNLVLLNDISTNQSSHLGGSNVLIKRLEIDVQPQLYKKSLISHYIPSFMDSCGIYKESLPIGQPILSYPPLMTPKSQSSGSPDSVFSRFNPEPENSSVISYLRLRFSLLQKPKLEVISQKEKKPIESNTEIITEKKNRCLQIFLQFFVLFTSGELKKDGNNPDSFLSHRVYEIISTVIIWLLSFSGSEVSVDFVKCLIQILVKSYNSFSVKLNNLFSNSSQGIISLPSTIIFFLFDLFQNVLDTHPQLTIQVLNSTSAVLSNMKTLLQHAASIFFLLLKKCENRSSLMKNEELYSFYLCVVRMMNLDSNIQAFVNNSKEIKDFIIFIKDNVAVNMDLNTKSSSSASDGVVSGDAMTSSTHKSNLTKDVSFPSPTSSYNIDSLLSRSPLIGVNLSEDTSLLPINLNQDPSVQELPSAYPEIKSYISPTTIVESENTEKQTELFSNFSTPNLPAVKSSEELLSPLSGQILVTNSDNKKSMVENVKQSVVPKSKVGGKRVIKRIGKYPSMGNVKSRSQKNGLNLESINTDERDTEKETENSEQVKDKREKPDETTGDDIPLIVLDLTPSNNKVASSNNQPCFPYENGDPLNLSDRSESNKSSTTKSYLDMFCQFVSPVDPSKPNEFSDNDLIELPHVKPAETTSISNNPEVGNPDYDILDLFSQSNVNIYKNENGKELLKSQTPVHFEEGESSSLSSSFPNNSTAVPTNPVHFIEGESSSLSSSFPNNSTTVPTNPIHFIEGESSSISSSQTEEENGKPTLDQILKMFF
jgi:hypothetical protein